MSGVRGARRNWSLAALVALVAAAVAAPTGLGFSTGITGDNAGPVPFDTQGCTACHGRPGEFPPLDNSAVQVQVVDAEGNHLNGVYTPETAYTVSIRLQETNAPEETNHAGFNLRVTAGELAAVAGVSQVSGDGLQATHVDATRTSWNVTWTAPAAGAAVFRLFVNDVDGDRNPTPGDQVRQIGFYFTDAEGGAVGAAVEPEEPHYGISLQQYWIGLIALAGMLFILLAGYVYLKYGSPHNTDAKDR